MRFIYVVNGKSIALQERIDSAIEDNKVPLSLFRASILNAIRKIHDGKYTLVEYNKLEKAIKSSYPKYLEKAKKAKKLINYGDMCLGLIKDYLENPTEQKLQGLLNGTGYLPAEKIVNLRMLITLLKRRIFDCDTITNIQKLIGKLNSLSGDIKGNKNYLNPNPINSDPFYNNAISYELLSKHKTIMTPKQISGLIYNHGIKTLVDLGFSVKCCELRPGGKHYVYLLKYKKLLIRCNVQNKQYVEDNENDRTQNDRNQYSKTS